MKHAAYILSLALLLSVYAQTFSMQQPISRAFTRYGTQNIQRRGCSTKTSGNNFFSDRIQSFGFGMALSAYIGQLFNMININKVEYKLASIRDLEFEIEQIKKKQTSNSIDINDLQDELEEIQKQIKQK